jgi:hypothetical protein
MGLSGGSDGKGGKKKKGNAKLESFRSNDGWEDDDDEDMYYVRGGVRRRKEISKGRKKR